MCENVQRGFNFDLVAQEAARDPAKVKILAALDYVAFGGAPLAKDVGDTLVSNGVNVVVGCGSSV
jgi:hypothetical protein